MANYLIIHKVERYPETQDEWIDVWRTIRKRSCEGTEWVYSFFDPSSNLLYCHWEAESEQDILGCLSGDIEDMAPIQHISEIVLFDTTWID